MRGKKITINHPRRGQIQLTAKELDGLYEIGSFRVFKISGYGMGRNYLYIGSKDAVKLVAKKLSEKRMLLSPVKIKEVSKVI